MRRARVAGGRREGEDGGKSWKKRWGRLGKERKVLGKGAWGD